MKEINQKWTTEDIEQIIDFVLESWSEAVIQTDKWSVVLMTEDEYNNLVEHIHISKSEKIMKKIHKKDEVEFHHYNSIKSLKDELDN